MIYSQRNSTENRNVPSQQKVSFEGRVNHGKGKGVHPEKEKEVAPGKEKETTTSEKEGEAVQERKVSQKRERGAAREKESVVSHGRDGENILGKETVHVTASGTGPETDVDQGMQCDFVFLGKFIVYLFMDIMKWSWLYIL